MAAVVAAALLSLAVPGRASAIIGGTTSGSLKGQAQIWINNGSQYRCTGSIIGARYILTADHCLYKRWQLGQGGIGPIPASTMRVFVGNRAAHQGQEIKVDGYAHAPKPPTALLPDIAILHLAKPVSNRSLIVKYAKGSGVLKGGLTVAIRGWGKPSKTGGAPAPALKVCSMNVGVTDRMEYQLRPNTGIFYDGDSGAGVWYGSVVQAVATRSEDDLSEAFVEPTPQVAGWIKRITNIDGVPL
ncbi:trypsin-like serine protease [Streptomyces melanogenes]|uniref:trypsin-like serine protease n=1 Tax=Streptomyces melanogenes TaxID=67326 RepID=UPI00378B507C